MLTQLIDDYVQWFVDWHYALAEDNLAPDPPARFAVWRDQAIQSLAGEQPAIEHVTTLHGQLHTLVKLVAMKKTERQPVDRRDDRAVAAKYLELMQALRRFERAFAAAASGLDPLTGLRTRHNLRQDMEREISRSVRAGRRFFVAMMDIDHFKTINDTYGHDNGDRVLAASADHISRSLRAHDDAYRLGGEEFLLCLKDTDAAGSLHVVERLRAGLEKATVVLADGRQVSVTASFGLAGCAEPITADDLLRKADEALYRAKHEGRNRVIVGS